MKLSICIPTYNRALLLRNCLESIRQQDIDPQAKVEVCVSDNFSTDNTPKIVAEADLQFPIHYNRNPKNLGIPRNFLKVVDMASGDFVWLVGDDDLLLPDTLTRLFYLLNTNPQVEFLFANAYQLSKDRVLAGDQPFDCRELAKINMERVSHIESNRRVDFFSLVDKKISFDFLGGMFLSIFSRSKWMEAKGALDGRAIADSATFSHFDNTFPHLRVFITAFAGSKDAYFNSEPLIVTLSGAREWSPMFPLVRSVRLVEAIEIYSQFGLPRLQYYRCKNFALRHFIPDVIKMLLKRNIGLRYLSLVDHVLPNLLYPSLWLSPLVWFREKVLSYTSRDESS